MDRDREKEREDRTGQGGREGGREGERGGERYGGKENGVRLGGWEGDHLPPSLPFGGTAPSPGSGGRDRGRCCHRGSGRAATDSPAAATACTAAIAFVWRQGRGCHRDHRQCCR